MPDLNRVDYAVQERVYHGSVDTVDQLIVLEWRALARRFIDYSIR